MSLSTIPRKNFKELFCGADGNIKPHTSVKGLALSGRLQNTGVRHLAWTFFLNGLPSNSSADTLLVFLTEKRSKYTKLVQEHIIDPRASYEKEMDPSINNPLSQDVESPWAKYFQNMELQRLINQDVERCYADKDFFLQTTIREMMLRILFIYSRETPSLSYRQGMHELLAPIVYLVDSERNAPTEATDENPLSNEEEELFKFLFDPKFVEHDTYIIFEQLMKTTGEWFSPGAQTPNTPKKARNSITATEEETPPEEPQTAVVSKCRRIQHIILRTRDPELHTHLDTLKIEPQLYLLRWVRLLLGREFHLEDIIILWDAIFAHNLDLSLVDYICVAMLIYIRSQLLERDYSGCMMRLFKYPPVEDIRLFVEQAITLSQNKPIPTFTSAVTSTTSAASIAVPAATEKQEKSEKLAAPERTPSPPTAGAKQVHFADFETKREKVQQPNRNNAHARSHSHGHPQPLLQETQQLISINPNFKHNLNMDVNSTNVAELQTQLKRLRDTQLAVAQSLEGIVQSIQKTIFENSSLTNIDPLVIALAELKQSKDILSGFLPIAVTPAENNHDKEEVEDDDVDKDEVDPLGVINNRKKEVQKRHSPPKPQPPPQPLPQVKKTKKTGEKKKVTFADDPLSS